MQFIRKTLALGAILLCASTNTFADGVKLNEYYSVEIKKLTATLDSGPHELTINVTWNFKTNPSASDYIDSNIIISDIKKFLTEYPSKSDFFEVVNHNLTSFLINKFKGLHGITVKINVPATKLDPYNHYTMVEATR